jgi:hypothetical protein
MDGLIVEFGNVNAVAAQYPGKVRDNGSKEVAA